MAPRDVGLEHLAQARKYIQLAAVHIRSAKEYTSYMDQAEYDLLRDLNNHLAAALAGRPYAEA